MHEVDGQVRFGQWRVEGDRPLLSKSNLARPAGYTTEDLLQTSASAAANLRLYTKSGAAAAAPRAFPQVAIGTTSPNGYTTEDSLQTSMPNCSEFAVVYQSPAATPDAGGETLAEDKSPPRFPPAEGRSPRGAPGASPARPSERRLPTAPTKKSAKSSKRQADPIRGEPLPRSSADFKARLEGGEKRSGARGGGPRRPARADSGGQAPTA